MLMLSTATPVLPCITIADQSIFFKRKNNWNSHINNSIWNARLYLLFLYYIISIPVSHWLHLWTPFCWWTKLKVISFYFFFILPWNYSIRQAFNDQVDLLNFQIYTLFGSSFSCCLGLVWLVFLFFLFFLFSCVCVCVCECVWQTWENG